MVENATSAQKPKPLSVINVNAPAGQFGVADTRGAIAEMVHIGTVQAVSLVQGGNLGVTDPKDANALVILIGTAQTVFAQRGVLGIAPAQGAFALPPARTITAESVTSADDLYMSTNTHGGQGAVILAHKTSLIIIVGVVRYAQVNIHIWMRLYMERNIKRPVQ